MRLHLDTNSAAGANAAAASTPPASTGKPNAGGGITLSGDSRSRDHVAVSNASSAWSASFADRAAKVEQLSAAVRGGTYHVSSAAISQSIVASAASGR